MRVDSSFRNVGSIASECSRRAGENSREVRRNEVRDHAEISSGGSNLQKLTSAALAAPDVRKERVSQLRDSIENGTYTVEPGLLADAMLNEII